MSVETKFPFLKCKITHEIDKKYNSVAWAMCDRSKWWEPDPFDIFYWPDNLDRKHTLLVFERLFESHGYRSVGKNDRLEDGCEKVAIFVLNGRPTHVARQKNSGIWTSKVGKCEEIEHMDLHQLVSEDLGEVATILRREVRQ
jgi:hypothetical protein